MVNIWKLSTVFVNFTKSGFIESLIVISIISEIGDNNIDRIKINKTLNKKHIYIYIF